MGGQGWVREQEAHAAIIAMCKASIMTTVRRRTGATLREKVRTRWDRHRDPVRFTYVGSRLSALRGIVRRGGRRRLHHGVDSGIATKKATITLEVEQHNAIRALVDARTAKSVSAFVQHAVGVSLNDVAGWGALLAEALEQTGGPLTKAERHWADGVLSARADKPAKRRANTKDRAA